MHVIYDHMDKDARFKVFVPLFRLLAYNKHTLQPRALHIKDPFDMVVVQVTDARGDDFHIR